MRLIAVGVVFVLSSSAARAQDVAAFYRGKQYASWSARPWAAPTIFMRARWRARSFTTSRATDHHRAEPAGGGRLVMTNQIYNQVPRTAP